MFVTAAYGVLSIGEEQVLVWVASKPFVANITSYDFLVVHASVKDNVLRSDNCSAGLCLYSYRKTMLRGSSTKHTVDGAYPTPSPTRIQAIYVYQNLVGQL